MTNQAPQDNLRFLKRDLDRRYALLRALLPDDDAQTALLAALLHTDDALETLYDTSAFLKGLDEDRTFEAIRALELKRFDLLAKLQPGMLSAYQSAPAPLPRRLS